MVELKTPDEVESMSVTGSFIAGLLDDLTEHADVGVNLLDLEHRARDLIRDAGRSPAIGTMHRPSGAVRSTTSSACPSTTRSCMAYPTTMSCATVISSAST